MTFKALEAKPLAEGRLWVLRYSKGQRGLFTGPHGIHGGGAKAIRHEPRTYMLPRHDSILARVGVTRRQVHILGKLSRRIHVR